jgi:hypothetical protein
MSSAASLMLPELGGLYRALAPWTELLLRIVVGLALVPHALRNSFGLFPNTGQPLRSIKPVFYS